MLMHTSKFINNNAAEISQPVRYNIRHQ